MASTLPVLCLLALVSLSAADKCTSIDSSTNCRCEVGNSGNGLDLTQVKQQFPAIPDSTSPGRTYAWGPCTNDLNLPDSCTPANDPAICQQDGSTTYLVGKYTQADYETDVSKESTVITYTGGDDSRVGKITLTCSKDDPGTATFVKEDPTLTYNLAYTGKYGCLVGVGTGTGSPVTKPSGGGGSGGGSLSLGSILTIVFFSLLVVYFVVGVIIMRFARGAQGTEMIPNRDVWISVPGLIKDGALLIVSPCRGQGNYEKV